MFRSVFILCVFSLLLSCNSVQATDNNVARADAAGQISQQDLFNHFPNFAEQYATYIPAEPDIAAMEQLRGTTVIVLFGSWCHDSVREVPRLLKLVEQSGVALASLQLHAVDRNKQHPDNLHNQYDLRYTPTFVVLRDGEELGRVIEKPQQSLAADLAALAKR